MAAVVRRNGMVPNSLELGPSSLAIGSCPEILGTIRIHHVPTAVHAQTHQGLGTSEIREKPCIRLRDPARFITRVRTIEDVMKIRQKLTQHSVSHDGGACGLPWYAIAAFTA